MSNGQDGIYTEDECRCDDPLQLFFCYLHNHYAWYCDCEKKNDPAESI